MSWAGLTGDVRDDIDEEKDFALANAARAAAISNEDRRSRESILEESRVSIVSEMWGR